MLKEIRRRLFELQDLKYKDFSCKLTPTVDPENVIGVCTLELLKLAYTESPLAARLYQEGRITHFFD